MKTLKQIREASGGKEAYQKFFNSLLKKYGVKSPSELDDKQKKKFYDEIDAGWESDDPNDKNERYEDPDNLDPEATVDGDEDQADKAASKDAGPLNAAYHKKKKMMAHKDKPHGKMMKAGYKMNAAYHKEDLDEAKKLKGGKGKAEIDINFAGDKKDIKFATTKYKIKMKPHSDGAIITGDKQKILAYLQGQDYDMDPEDIEDLYPELMESNYPKPLSIIRQNKLTDDALEEAYGINEKMAMCEDCGKMHAEGACEMDMEEGMSMRSIGLKGASKRSRDKARGANLSSAELKKAEKIAKKHSGNMKKAMAEIEKIKKGSSESDAVMAILKKANEDTSEDMYMHTSKKKRKLKAHKGDHMDEANRFSKKLKGAAKDLFALSWKAGGKSKAYGDKEWNAAVDKMAAKYRDDNHVRISDKDIAAVKQAIKHESVSEAVSVDRRTMGFKEAMKRRAEAKAKREAAKIKAAKTQAKNDMASIDANYAYDGEVASILADANAKIMGEDAPANASSSGAVDMNTNGKSVKKKKDKENLMAKYGY